MSASRPNPSRPHPRSRATRGHRAVTVLAVLAVLAGLLAAAKPTPAFAITVHLSRSAVSAADQPAGDFVTTFDDATDDGGMAYSQGAGTDLLNKVNGDQARLGDEILRSLTQYSLGSYGINPAQFRSFDGTLSATSDHSGLSITIPAAEANQIKTSGVPAAVQSLISAAISFVLNFLLVTGCLAVFPAAAVACPVFASVTASLIASIVAQAIGGTLSDPTAWAATLAGAVTGVLTGTFGASVLKWGKETLAPALNTFAGWVQKFAQNGWVVYLAVGPAVTNAANFVRQVSSRMPTAFTAASSPTAPISTKPCDVYTYNDTPCVAAHGMTRALYSGYAGPLYQVQRASDGAKSDIGVTAPGGTADAARQDSFCANTSCTVSRIYDQSPIWNDLGVEGGGGANPNPDRPANAAALPVTVGGQKAYGLYVSAGVGYRNNATHAIAQNGQPEGMYMVASGTHVNSGCCFDYGNGERNTQDTGNGHMDAVNLGTECYFPPCTGGGPWVEADLENGLFSGDNGSNLANKGNSSNFVTALLKNNGQTTYALKGGDSQGGGLSTWWSGGLPTRGGYRPMQQEGAIMLGTGGDNSNWSIGSFFEGVMTQGYPTDAADNAVQAGIVAAKYAGNSGGIGDGSTAATTPTADQAVVHTGYSSVYTVDAANGHLRETYLPKMGDPWSSQDLSAKYGTPAVQPGTQPVALTHGGYTSVYTIDAGSNDVQETYLTAMGQPWATQDLTQKYGTPVSNVTPTAVLHDGYTSVYTVDSNGQRSGGDLQETYLTAIGQPWHTQDLSANYGTPKVLAGTSPVALVHGGYTSVYSVNGNNHHLQETYLTAIGANWVSQDLTANYGAPVTITTPGAVLHDGYTSVYTVDDPSNDLQETYLAGIGSPWATQDLSAKYGTPHVLPGTHPAAMVHTGYTSVYTVDENSGDVQETYLAGIGAPWASQDFTTKYGTPTTAVTPVPLLHPDAGGALTWSSVFSLDEFNDHLQETFLPAIGNNWTTKDLTAQYGTPPALVAADGTDQWSAAHAGYTSVYTVDKSNGHLRETYLTAMGQPWATQDLSTKYGTPVVRAQTIPVVVVHDGYTSVLTVDAGTNDLQETYLSNIGNSWATHDLTSLYKVPAVATLMSPSAVYNAGHTYVFTVDSGSNHLQETSLSQVGAPWITQDLTSTGGAPAVIATSSPAAVVHSGWLSVFSIDSGSNHLQETYLSATDASWVSQDLSAKYGTPAAENANSPAALVHSDWTSVYTVDGNGHLQETYLPGIGDAWITQDLSAKFGTPTVATANPPVPLFHTGYTSVYTIDSANHHLQETYVPAIGDPWATQDLTANYGTPAADQAPSAVLHYDSAGGLTYASVYTVDESNDHLQETYLPAIGGSWATQDLSDKYGVPAV